MFTIINKKTLNDNVVSVTVRAPMAAAHAQAGQFVIVRPRPDSERIPLTIADSDGENITLVFQRIGETTAELAALVEGENICDVCGPLGNPTRTDGVKSVIVVGGGVGCAIALPVVKAFKKSGAYVHAVLGFRTKNLVILEDEFKAAADNLTVMTDDGSYGEKGLVTSAVEALLGERAFDETFAIGPLAMMKFVCKTTAPFHVKTVVSMNPIMIDGTGMCGGCRLTVGGKTAFACVDGPDFDGSAVDFDSLSARNGHYSAFEREHKNNCNLFRLADEQ